jgi:hypothetical protein
MTRIMYMYFRGQQERSRPYISDPQQWVAFRNARDSGHVLFQQPNGTRKIEKEPGYLDELDPDYLDKLWLEVI